jgi:hypothetical protein
MRWTQIIWNHLPDGNIEHIEEHDLTTKDVDFVLEHHDSRTDSRSSGRGCLFGYTPDGRYIIVAYEDFGDTVVPVTAYEVDPP